MPPANVWVVNCNFCKNVQFCPKCGMTPPHPHIKDCAKAKLEREGDKGRLDELFVLKELGRYCPSCETPQAPECELREGGRLEGEDGGSAAELDLSIATLTNTYCLSLYHHLS